MPFAVREHNIKNKNAVISSQLTEKERQFSSIEKKKYTDLNSINRKTERN